MKILTRLRAVKSILLDVDGVLTDNRGGGPGDTRAGETVGAGSEAALEVEIFSTPDGVAIVRAVAAGLCVGIITARRTPQLDRRAAELGITDVYQGNLNKIEPYEQFKRAHHFTDAEVAYMGDGILDLSCIRKAGFAAAPSNAHPSVKIAAHFVSELPGGHGAVKDVIDRIIRARRSVA